MNLIQKHSILFLIMILALTGLACQAVTGGLQSEDASMATSETAVVDQDAIIAQAVATVSAQTVNETVTLETTLPSVNVDLQNRLIDIYQRINPSVVHIFLFNEQGFTLGTGSGFVFDTEGNIVTNNHVITDGDLIEVVFTNGERSRATVVGTDVDSDLAVIQAETVPVGIQPLALGDSSSLNVGEFVVAIGNPFGEAGSMSVGIVSGLGRTLSSQRILPSGGTFSIPQVIQTDAAINPGNSGGPLLNLDGEVVGVNSAIQTLTGENSGVGFSIPVNAVKNIAPELIDNGRYTYSYIGISMVPTQLTLTQLEELDLPPNGVYITSVEPNTPADEAGLIGVNGPGGDYITAVNDEPVSTSDELLSYLVFETQPGDTINLTIIRDGEEMVVPLTLGERP